MALNVPSLTKVLHLPSIWPKKPIRLAIIGNSHLAALKLAERDGLVETNGFSTCYYGAIGRPFSNMKLENGALDMGSKKASLFVTDGRFEKLPLDQFDAFLFHGGGFRYSKFLKQYEEVDLTPAMVSSAFLVETARQALHVPDRLRRLARAVADEAKVPVLLSPSPLKARSSDIFKEASFRKSSIADLDKVLKIAALETHLYFLPQPSETIVDHVYTNDRFTVGSVRLKGDMTSQHAVDDYGHMNEQFGAHVLKDAFDRLRKIFSEQNTGRVGAPGQERGT